ncbi:hypothetical protein [Thermoanaerobacterium sp. DL9XJH110]|uniref:hypothetical protein n=1 Tax=Thermoanaerobacterium sp. DL9XJH110 TaxID=3386643 RepID=UPI003BB7AD55
MVAIYFAILFITGCGSGAGVQTASVDSVYRPVETLFIPSQPYRAPQIYNPPEGERYIPDRLESRHGSRVVRKPAVQLAVLKQILK